MRRRATGMRIAQRCTHCRLVHTLVRRLVSVQRHTHSLVDLAALRPRVVSVVRRTLGTIDFELRVLSQEAALREQLELEVLLLTHALSVADATLGHVCASAARTRDRRRRTRARAAPDGGLAASLGQARHRDLVPSGGWPRRWAGRAPLRAARRPSPRARRAAAASRHTRSLIFLRD